MNEVDIIVNNYKVSKPFTLKDLIEDDCATISLICTIVEEMEHRGDDPLHIFSNRDLVKYDFFEDNIEWFIKRGFLQKKNNRIYLKKGLRLKGKWLYNTYRVVEQEGELKLLVEHIDEIIDTESVVSKDYFEIIGGNIE